MKHEPVRYWQQAARILVTAVAVVVMSVLVAPAQAGDAPPVISQQGLSLDQAITMALARSEAVRKAEQETLRTEELRDRAARLAEFAPTEPAYSAVVELPWANLLAADLTWQMSKRALTAEEDAVVLDTSKKYWEVLRCQQKEAAAAVALGNAERVLRNARVSLQVGTLSAAAVVAAEAQHAAAETALASARGDLDKAYTALNLVLGLAPGERRQLTDAVTFEALGPTDLDVAVSHRLEQAPTVWLAEEMVTMKTFLQEMAMYSGEYSPFKVREIEVQQARLDAASTRQLFEMFTRSLYYGVRNLEEAYRGAKEGVRAAQENVRVAKVRLDVGVGTPAEVSAAEKALADAQTSVVDLVAQHAYLKLAFDKPWAYLKALSGGSA